MSSYNYIWQTNRPFNSYSNYIRQKFSYRIQKLSVDAGFSCPNRDGFLSYNGCSFCSNEAFSPSYLRNFKSINQQIEEGIKFHNWRYKHSPKYLAYFQSYSNTYASINILKEKYEQALQHNDVIGLVIGTRPDCIDDEKLEYLQQLSEQYYIVIEYGIESCYDKTLKAINRQHTFDCTVKALQKTKQYNIHTGGHLIFGFPNETYDEMLAQADIISSLHLDSIKFHQLQILKNTAMYLDYTANPNKYKLFNFEQYKELIIRFVERLNPNIMIERFAAEVPPRFNALSGWNIRNEQIVQQIEQEMLKQHTYQGRLYKHCQ